MSAKKRPSRFKAGRAKPTSKKGRRGKSRKGAARKGKRTLAKALRQDRAGRWRDERGRFHRAPRSIADAIAAVSASLDAGTLDLDYQRIAELTGLTDQEVYSMGWGYMPFEPGEAV